MYQMKYLILFFITAFTFLLADIPELSAETILDSMTAIMKTENLSGTMEQEIISSSGRERTFEYNYYSANNGEDVLLRYTLPKKVRHNAFLIKNGGDDIWVYFPRTRRVRKLANHAKNQKVQGSDFSYNDFSGSGDWNLDYTAKKVFSGERDNYLLVLFPKNQKEDLYEKLQIYVDKLSFFPHRIEYFAKDSHLKTLFLEDIKTISRIPTAMTMRMVNHLEKSNTTMRILEMDYNIEFEADFFTERNLKK